MQEPATGAVVRVFFFAFFFFVWGGGGGGEEVFFFFREKKEEDFAQPLSTALSLPTLSKNALQQQRQRQTGPWKPELKSSTSPNAT